MSESCIAQIARQVGLESMGMTKLSAEEVRRTPPYTFSEAAHYLRVPVTTLRAWCVGQDYKSKGRSKHYHRVVRLDGTSREGLSFLNLVGAHVLSAGRYLLAHGCQRQSSPTGSRLGMRSRNWRMITARRRKRLRKRSGANSTVAKRLSRCWFASEAYGWKQFARVTR
jgi:hypothetical protein